MTMTQDQIAPKMKLGEDLKKIIDKAIKKVQGDKENDLCKFLPGPSGGYMHHFTLRKLKHTNPDQLNSLLQEYIIEPEKPLALDPKPRAPRGSRKRRDIVSFSRNDIEKVLELARKYGDKDLVAKFSPKRSLASMKRELIRSIRENRVNHDLWNAFVESMAAINASSAN